MRSDCRLKVAVNVCLNFYVIIRNKMSEEQMRNELEEITKELVRLQNKKYRTDIIEKNKEYKEICYKMWFLEERKKNLLNLIKKLHG